MWLTAALSVAAVAVAQGPGGPGADAFPRGVYWPQERVAWLAERAGVDRWEYMDRLLADLHDKHHCNLIWTVNIGTDDLKRLCQMAAGHGIQVAGSVEPVLWWRQHRTPEFALKCAEETAKRLADTEGLQAYVLIDEPRAWELPYLDAIRRELAQIDDTRLTLMVTMRGDTPSAIHRTGFPIITSDIYPFFFKGDPNGPNPAPVSRAYYRLCTGAFGRQCQDAGKTFWIMPQAFMEVWGDWYYDAKMRVVAQPGAYLHWRMPTVGETRWQIWEGLAGGAKGVIFFVLFPPKNERAADSEPGPPADHPYPKISETRATGEPAALLNPDSSPTPQMVAMGEAFADVERLTPVLRGLRRGRFPAAFAEPPFHCRTLENDQGDLYAVVVNDDTGAAATGGVGVLPGIAQMRDLRAQTDLPLAAAGDGSLQRAELELGPGDGTLLQLVAEPARRPLAAAIEDFSTPLVTGSLEGAQVRVRRLPWGVGWEHEVVQADEAEDAKPGTLTCSIAMLTGDPKVHRPSGPIYVVYQGRGAADNECVELGFSSDGEQFERASGDEFGRPVPVPRGVSHLRFTISNGGSLSGFCALATETGG